MESQLLEMGEMVCVRHLVPAGFDSGPLYRGLPDDMCPCEHWCYLAKGRMRYRLAGGESRTFGPGDAFHVLGGHLADVLEDAELIELTRADEYRHKADHVSARLIENPASGEQVLFRQVAAETDGELLEMDDFWLRPDHRTPEHVHPGMEERWEVLAGTVGFRIAGVERTAGPGAVVVAPPGTPHNSWNAGGKAVHLRIQMRPALRWQEFVERLFREPAAGRALMAEFDQEIAPAVRE